MSRGHLGFAAIALAACTLVAARAAAGVNIGTDTQVAPSVPAPAQGYTVAILADRTAGSDAGLAVLDRAVAEINLLKPDLVVHIGDLVPGYIRDMDRWEQDIARVKAILGRLEAPIFPVAGNHDVITGTDNPDDRRGEELYKRYFGPLYYSFDYRDTHFIVLYTEETLRSAPRLSQTQLDWLQKDLSASTTRQIFIFLHKPVWEYPDAGWDAVHEMLRQHPVRAVIAGHFHHYYKSVQRDGIQYYVLGVTGGQLFSPELAGGLEHYCMLRIEPDGFRLALVKPGSVLADDYIGNDDYKNMERLRLLSEAETGVAVPIRSPENGSTDEQAAVTVTNPLDVPLKVVVTGVARGGVWTFSPEARTLAVQPGGREHVSLGVRSPQVPAERLVAPEVEVEYTYVDSRGRNVPIVLPRRIPLMREVEAPATQAAISLDGQATEEAWRQTPLLTTLVWRASPYETGEPGPTFRILSTGAGLYFYAESSDSVISDFRADRILSDALFVGAVPPSELSGRDLKALPVVVIFPFSRQGSSQALRAFWDPVSPVGVEAQGVHVVTKVLADRKGWRCEGFVPWDVLLADPAQHPQEMLFNMGAWDNDGDLFTELHSWAPTADAAEWGRLSLEAPAEP
jgi:UDP-2,3-diacylglucosamine pyrophosphatase LpxH